MCIASCLSLWSCSGGFGTFRGGTISYADPRPPEDLGPGPGSFADTWTDIHLFQVFDGRITRSQAKQDAPLYDLVWGTVKPSAWKEGNWHILTSFYAPFDGDFATGHGLVWWKANHPDWVLYRCDEKTPAWPGGLKNVPLDISNPAVVRWQMKTYGPVMEAGYDGLAADLVGLNNANGGCGVFVDGVWTPRFTGQMNDDAWSQAVLAWMRYAFGYLHQLPRPLTLGINHVPENRPFGDPEEADLINHMDFEDDESSFTDYGNGYASNGKVGTIIQWMHYIQSRGKAYIVDDKWNTGSIDHQQLGWSIATYLLGKYHHSTVYIDHLPGYGYEYWYPQYDAKVGSPCDDAVKDPNDNGIYYRKYTGSYVVVNASINQTFTVTLPHATYTSIFGKTIHSPLTLPPDTGAVLLGPKGCH